ncbi:glycosyltransferase family 8 protein [Pontibacter chinhatensis]|uniref:Lipopolysaccharide biosynthesis protein, LPS:glycosyltransferase n=1 Tax=Pontibacter chinhatensis TaxID=1436961 RepID=A0A1I2X0Z0_9BACT|nr:glycosyltransferase family 8 protein [Pontibacter chinhatensis]SFH06549.1 Lipopolysaccharide biosynthesis protein, LPS:glycosyltransferase [Pontibacter chinhatensis]
MNIAFCINRLGLVGLGGALSSLIRNCSEQSKLRIWFLCAGMISGDKERISRLLDDEKFSGSYQYIDFDPKHYFGIFASLHGDWTTYGRLLLADIIDEERVLYLDSDLLVEVDVLELENFDFEGQILAAVGGGKFKYTLGNKFYIDRVGMCPETEYFNAGVLLLNLKLWRQNQVKNECLAIAKKYQGALPSHDQSLLNILCAGEFAKLLPAFNCQWEANTPKPQVADRMVLHFIGSPKPWDPLGFMLHNGYDVWYKYFNHEWSAFYGQLTFAEIVRIWHIRRSYIRCIMTRIKANKKAA